MVVVLQNAVSRAKGLVLVHQEYQRALHVFEEWLEQEQATLASLSHPEGNVETLETTLQQLQVLICCIFLILDYTCLGETGFVCLTFNWPTFPVCFLVLFLTAAAGPLLTWPVSAFFCADQQRESDPLGFTSD